MKWDSDQLANRIRPSRIDGSKRSGTESRIIKIFTAFALLAPIFLLPAAQAEEPAEHNPTLHPVVEASDDLNDSDMVDDIHENLSERVEKAAESLDHFLDNTIAPDREERSSTFDRYFGDRRLEAEEEGESYISIAPQLEFIDGQSFDTGVDFSAKIDLPKSQHRLKIIVENVQEDTDPLPGYSREELNQIPGTDESTNASLRFTLIDRVNFDTDLDSGLDFRPEPVPKFRLRLRWKWEAEAWRFRFSQYLIYEADDGFGEKTSIDLRRYIGDSTWTEIDAAMVKSETSAGYEFGQSLGFYHRISDRRTIGFRAGVYSQTEPWARIEDVLVRLPYRQKIWKEWMYLKVEPGIDFNRIRNFNADPRILFELEFLFGDRRKNL